MVGALFSSLKATQRQAMSTLEKGGIENLSSWNLYVIYCAGEIHELIVKEKIWIKSDASVKSLKKA